MCVVEMEIPADRPNDGGLPKLTLLPRSSGSADLRFKLRDKTTVFDRLFQSGCLRVLMPAPERDAPPEAIMINTSGGLTGGDQLALSAEWQPGTSAILCNQAAEKIYRSSGADVLIANRLKVGAKSSAEWLPQETILFNGAKLRRTMEIRVAESGRFLGVETVVFGRSAMGEEIRAGDIRDIWRVSIGPRLCYVDILRMNGAIAARLDRTAIGACARAIGTILLVARDNLGAMLESIRAALANARGRVAASQWNGVLAVRFLANDGEILRHDIALALDVLRAGRPLPRAWRS